jgi:hypothetical protein
MIHAKYDDPSDRLGTSRSSWEAEDQGMQALKGTPLGADGFPVLTKVWLDKCIDITRAAVDAVICIGDVEPWRRREAQ